MRYYPLILIFCLTACTVRPLEYRGPSVGQYNFNYSIEAPRRAGLIQVFDDGERTYFKIYRAEEKEIPRFFEAGIEEELKVKLVHSNLLVVDGVYPQVEVRNGNRRSFVSQIPVEKKRTYNANLL